MIIIYILFWITSLIYAYNAFNAMEYLIGQFWAFIWTFPIPLGVVTFPFWGRLFYGYSDPNLWVSYFIPIFLYLTLMLLGFGRNILSPKAFKNVEIKSGYSVDLKRSLETTSRTKRLGAFLIDYIFLYFFINIFEQGWVANLDPVTFEYTYVGAIGGIVNSIMLLFTAWFLFFALVPVFTRGSTFGKLIFRTRLYKIDNEYLQLPDYIVILKREFLRFIFISMSTYGSFLFPVRIGFVLGFYFGLVLWLLFFAAPYLLIFTNNKITLFDYLVKTTVANRFINFENNLTNQKYNTDSIDNYLFEEE